MWRTSYLDTAVDSYPVISGNGVFSSTLAHSCAGTSGTRVHTYYLRQKRTLTIPRMQRVSYIILLYQSRKYKRYKDFRSIKKSKNHAQHFSELPGETRLGHMADRCVYTTYKRHDVSAFPAHFSCKHPYVRQRLVTFTYMCTYTYVAKLVPVAYPAVCLYTHVLFFFFFFHGFQ